jgi:dTDP-4-amino-4,6-dideoxygalactose transaminase
LGTGHATAGEGGLLVTNDAKVFERCVAAHDLGIPSCETGTVTWGAGQRMSELTGAVAATQLKKLPTIVAHMRGSKSRIKAMLAGTPGLGFRRLNDEAGDAGPFLILVVENEAHAMRVTDRMQAAGLATAVRLTNYGMHIYYNVPQLVAKVPLSSVDNPWSLSQNKHSRYEYGKGSCPQSDELFAWSVLLPIPSRLTRAQENAAAKIIKAALSPA